MKRGALGSVALGVAFALASCSVDDVDLAGKRCPCVSGFVCDVATSTCVRPGTVDDDADVDPPVDPPPPVPLPPLPPPNGRIAVTDLAVAWVTPNQVRWTWKASGDPNDFAEYQIRTGATVEQIDKPETVIGARLWTRVDSPELAQFAPRAPSQASPATVWSVTFDHRADTDVLAQVYAIDRAGNASRSAIVTARTRPPYVKTLNLYNDALPAGAVATPAAFKPSGQDTYAASQQCYALPVTCGATETSCQKDVAFTSLPQVLPAGFTAAELPTAYVDFALGGDAAVPGAFTTFELQIGSGQSCAAGAVTACRYRFGGLSLAPGGGYRRYQLPLSALARGNGEPLSFQALSAEAMKLFGVYWGGALKAGGVMRVDAVRLRW